MTTSRTRYTRSNLVWSFIRLTRVIFLLGGALQYALGSILAWTDGHHVVLIRYLIGQAMVTSIQIMAHYGNEFFDIEGDLLNQKNRTWFSGGSGVIQSGLISPQTVKRAMYGFAAISVILITISGLLSPWTGLIGIVSLIGAWFYSAPPLAFMSSGWGELTTSLIVAVLVPLTGYTMQAASVSFDLILLCIPFVFIHAAMLIAFEIPDFSSDRAIHKDTITVRLGIPKTIFLHLGLIFVGLAIGFGFWLFRFPGTRFFWIQLPVAIWSIVSILISVRNDSSPSFHSLTTSAVALFATSSLSSVISLLSSTVR